MRFKVLWILYSSIIISCIVLWEDTILWSPVCWHDMICLTSCCFFTNSCFISKINARVVPGQKDIPNHCAAKETLPITTDPIMGSFTALRNYVSTYNLPCNFLAMNKLAGFIATAAMIFLGSSNTPLRLCSALTVLIVTVLCSDCAGSTRCLKAGQYLVTVFRQSVFISTDITHLGCDLI